LDIAQITVEAVVGVAALALATLRIRSQQIIEKRQQATREAEDKTRADEVEIKREELALSRERNEASERSLENQMAQLQLSGSALATDIALELNRHTDWAVRALEGAKLHPGSKTLIAGRMLHYPDEKEYLGGRFVPVIMTRCKAFFDAGFHVVLIVDSGSTLLPVIHHLCEYVNDRRDDNWLISKGLTVYTNSLAGATVFMQSAHASADDHSELSVDFHVLPGIPLPTFAGVAGKDSLEALENIRVQQHRESGKPVKIIALLTGNWVQLTRHLGPIPLARGTDHFDFKQKVANEADEVYVIAPLGKIFFGLQPEQINAALKSVGHTGVGKRKSYNALSLEKAKMKKMKLVTTYRPSDSDQEFLLAKLSERIYESMNEPEEELKLTKEPLKLIKDPSEDTIAAGEFDSIPSLAFRFVDVGERPKEQLRAEFPHRDTRRETFLSNFFLVPHGLCKKCF
jgi:hypothetical protein